MKSYFAEIDNAIKRYEEYKYPTHSIEWITDRIEWCWKFKHIDHREMENLAERITEVIENGGSRYYM